MLNPMWNNFRSASFSVALFLGALSNSAGAAGTPIDQTNAQAVAEDLNRKGSDQSMQSSTTSAMKALMHFANGEMPSAVNNGMTAYGKYRNSENLDSLGDQNVVNAASMASAGSTGITKVVKTNTSFRRLDPNFLRTGEAGKIADEFEQKSGMKREQFLKELSDVSEKKISRSDPLLMDKALSRLETFASHIPNAEFRGKIEKGINRVPATVRNGLIGKAIAKFAGFMAGGADTSAAPATTAKADGSGKAQGTEGKPEITEAAPSTASPTEAGIAPAENPSSASNGSHPSDMFGSVIRDAIHTQAEELSIFEQVTRKIRTLSPELQKK
jgi:hypothetical protein